MMKAMKKLNGNEMRSMANGVMDGISSGVIMAVAMYILALLAKYVFFGFDLSVWFNLGSWNELLTLAASLATAVACWVFCDISHDWRNYINKQLDSAELIASEVHFYKPNRTRLMIEARQQSEQGLRPERFFERERKIYKIIRCSIILLLVVSALTLSIDGLIFLKLMLTVGVAMIAVVANKCNNRRIFGCW